MATPGTASASGQTTGEEGMVLGTVTTRRNPESGEIRYLIITPSADLNMEGQAIPSPGGFQPGAAGEDATAPLTLTLIRTPEQCSWL
jgi:hypothetical protein